MQVFPCVWINAASQIQPTRPRSQNNKKSNFLQPPNPTTI